MQIIVPLFGGSRLLGFCQGEGEACGSRSVVYSFPSSHLGSVRLPSEQERETWL
jgi:hypothetical protein